MDNCESDAPPSKLEFDLAIVAVGYERRCRWLLSNYTITAQLILGLEFGYLPGGSYEDNVLFFRRQLGCKIINGMTSDAAKDIAKEVRESIDRRSQITVLIDISSMSRSMIANVVLAIQVLRKDFELAISVAYLPSKFVTPKGSAPIRIAEPIKPSLAGWSARPERPIGVICGLGFEEGLALGALQFLEPDKTWVFVPVGIDPRFGEAVTQANQYIGDIFDTSHVGYQITQPTFTRGKLEALLNAVSNDFRVIVVPFGPKIFAWLALATIVFFERADVGIWAFSSKDQEKVIDRDAEGEVVWHSLKLAKYTRPDEML